MPAENKIPATLCPLFVLIKRIELLRQMRKSFFSLLLFAGTAAQAQTDTATPPEIFNRVVQTMQSFTPDTTAPPADKTTARIKELIRLRGGFNLPEAVAYMIAEEWQKGETPKAVLDARAAFFTTGNGARWMNHALVWICRSHFTDKELKQLIRFYKTGAGRKMAADFPIIVLKSLAVGEMLKKLPDESSF